MIPDQGTLNETPPTRLLLSLFEQSQTGILYLRQNEILKVFYLNRGKISWAISSDESDRLDHILLDKKLVAPEVLAPFQAGNKISETFGKVLVENGILTLDSLIQATREQVRHIAFSVMRWNAGNYQLVQESPPNRLVSLDIDISSIVAEFILGQMDVNIVWEEMGSLSGELKQDPDPGKMRRYSLDVEQQELLARFSDPRRLDSVLLDFPAERKHRILKLIYFFLQTGLLKKKEAEKSTHIDFNELDSLFGQSQANAPDEVDIEMPAMIDETAIQDIPLGEMPEITMEKETSAAEPEMPDLPDLIPDEMPEAKEAGSAPRVERQEPLERPRPQPFLRPEKQKSSWLSVPILSILLVVILIGAFLWLSRGSDRPAKETARPAAAKKQPGKTEAAKEAAGTSETAAPPDGAGTEHEAEPSLEPAAVPQAAPPEAAAVEKHPAVKPAAPADESLAWKHFAAGNYRAAGDIWRGVMLEARVTFSILLEMDCQKASVRSAYRQVTDPEGFFLLNRTLGDGRTCWLVLWGRFRTADEAALAMKLVPEYFLKQSHPPSVIELGPYLN